LVVLAEGYVELTLVSPPQELVDRYNPTHDMSQAERIEATAHRVGLQGPVEYDASSPRPIPMEGETEGESTKEQEDAKGSLQTMFAPQQ
jgi:hypothetical protein